ncbi:BRCT domain-containing protein [Schizosaccharomyces cryophilus OY26]|uniref:BRCT domain-containing protein n=1 Tax=Schizosaccharomyces cryophilus (strain OY26 / ATCC MYA-4695 / CBS 11777 / NBRC 106824 / NRRL Y48691) TaxID=653667 RepID=S9W5L2_SCHCR|nr:BRCT domain-containing protein [Schizosaccharomyces cryophilus OY26]EPY53270.1 BRCT domain-containing protein [Schizosaccharomyces cryophilus OY26]
MEIQIGDRRQNLYQYGGFINIFDYNVNQFESADSIAEIYIQDGQVFFRNIQSRATFQKLRLLPSPSEKKLFYHIPLYETLYINDIKTIILPGSSNSSFEGVNNSFKTGTTTIPNTPQKPSQPQLSSLTEPRVNKPYIFDTKSETKLQPVWGKKSSAPYGQLSHIAPETTTLDLEKELFAHDVPESQPNEKDSKDTMVKEPSTLMKPEEERDSKENQDTLSSVENSDLKESTGADEEKVAEMKPNRSFEQGAAHESDTTNEEENNIPSTPAGINDLTNRETSEKENQQFKEGKVPPEEEQGKFLHDQQTHPNVSGSEEDFNIEGKENIEEKFPQPVSANLSDPTPERKEDIEEHQKEVQTSQQILQETEENESKDLEVQEQEKEEEEIPLTNYTFPSSSASNEEHKDSQSQPEGISIVTSSFNLTKPMQAFARRKGIKIQDSVTDTTDCIILGPPPLRRTHKFLLATSLGKPPVSSRYILDSMKEGTLLNYHAYLYEDQQAEEKWKFSLKAVHRRKCLQELKFYITTAMRNSMVGDSIQGLYSIMKTSGAKVVEDIQEAQNPQVIILGLPANDEEGYNMFSTGLRVYKMELVALSILRDKIDFDEFIIDYSQRGTTSTGSSGMSGRNRKRSSRSSFSKSRSKEQKT